MPRRGLLVCLGCYHLWLGDCRLRRRGNWLRRSLSDYLDWCDLSSSALRRSCRLCSSSLTKCRKRMNCRRLNWGAHRNTVLCFYIYFHTTPSICIHYTTHQNIRQRTVVAFDQSIMIVL